MPKTITKTQWRNLKKQSNAYVKLAWNRNGKRYINDNGIAKEVTVIGMRN